MYKKSDDITIIDVSAHTEFLDAINSDYRKHITLLDSKYCVVAIGNKIIYCSHEYQIIYTTDFSVLMSVSVINKVSTLSNLYVIVELIVDKYFVVLAETDTLMELDAREYTYTNLKSLDDLHALQSLNGLGYNSNINFTISDDVNTLKLNALGEVHAYSSKTLEKLDEFEAEGSDCILKLNGMNDYI